MDVEDVDMTAKETRVVTYITVDTNILLDDLQTVQALYRILSLPSLHSSIQLLVPQTVLHGISSLPTHLSIKANLAEIDNHHKLGKLHIRHQAREANRLLNRLIKSRQLDQRVPFRAQRLQEIIRDNLSRPDDRILDCCLYFAARCEQIWLWTKDQVFETIARSNDIHVLQMAQLSSIVQSLGIAEAAGVKEQVKDFMSARPAFEVAVEIDESGMEVDEDLYFDLPALVAEIENQSSGTILAPAPDGTRSLLSDLLSRYSSNVVEEPDWSVPDNTAMRPKTAPLPSVHTNGNSSPTKSATPRISEADLHARLENALAPLFHHLGIDNPRPDRFLATLLETLLDLDNSVYPDNGDRAPIDSDRQILLIAIDGTRTLARYCERPLFDKSRKPRLGDVAEAIEAVKSLGEAYGLGGEVAASCQELAALVRMC